MLPTNTSCFLAFSLFKLYSNCCITLNYLGQKDSSWCHHLPSAISPDISYLISLSTFLFLSPAQELSLGVFFSTFGGSWWYLWFHVFVTCIYLARSLQEVLVSLQKNNQTFLSSGTCAVSVLLVAGFWFLAPLDKQSKMVDASNGQKHRRSGEEEGKRTTIYIKS